MKRNQGIGFIALGLGKTIAEGKKSLRFSHIIQILFHNFIQATLY